MPRTRLEGELSRAGPGLGGPLRGGLPRPAAVRAGTLLVLLALGVLLQPVPVSARVVPGISRLVNQARPFAYEIARHHGVKIQDRLAVMLLSTHTTSLSELATEESHVHKSITLLLKHIGRFTPLDVYVWVRENVAPPDPAVQPLNAIGANIAVMPILSEHWQRRHMDHYLADVQLEFNDYRIMGQWRLEVQFAFGSLLGYEYILQFDDDSYVLGPYPHNIITQLRDNNALMGGRHICWDPSFYFAGLPELARTYIVMHTGEFGHVYNHLPPEKRFEMPTRLFKHCYPGNMTGLMTKLNNTNIGYDNSYVYGNFLIMKAELWMRPLVQDFVQMCLLSGGVYRHRWIDQSVEAFVWQLFVPEEEGRDQFLLFKDLPYWHGKPNGTYLSVDNWRLAMDGKWQPPEPGAR